MSQQYDFPPPPPTPGNGGYFQSPRRPAPPTPAITTGFPRSLQGVQQAQAGHTPASGASSLNSPFPFSPHVAQSLDGASAVGTPRSATMAAQSYNPRQWSQRGHGSASGTQMVFQRAQATNTRDLTGNEAAMPSPPPPYSSETSDSIPRSVYPSLMVDSGIFAASPLLVESATSTRTVTLPGRHSPQIPTTPSFPPPPPQQSSRYRERSSSARDQRSFFGLAALASRNKQPVLQVEAETIHSRQTPPYQEVPARAPASRRAASTGHIGTSASAPVSAVPAGRSSPESTWQPGMPLPPPPPGPPPAGARSQSLNRYALSRTNSQDSIQDSEIGAPQPRMRAAAVSSLGAVPPTPADWVDEDPARPAPAYQPLRIDTGAQGSSSAGHDPSIIRRPARRVASAQGIRERRSTSRAAKEPTVNDPVDSLERSDSDQSRPSDLVLSATKGSISRRRANGSRNVQAQDLPSQSLRGQPSQSASAPMTTPPYTPAVESRASQKRAVRTPRSGLSDRVVSHLLNAPIEGGSMAAPLSPARPPTGDSTKKPPATPNDAFFQQAAERHRMFMNRESNATSDEERLELFANFIVHESRLRRDRYSVAYNAMAGDLIDLTRDLWRSHTGGRRGITPSTSMSSIEPALPSWTSDQRGASSHMTEPSSASSTNDFTPGTDVSSMCDPADIERANGERWDERFKPSLSPIPSMAVSTVPDEDSSRGRTPSRWWEGSASGSSGRSQKIERSTRETKFMGVNAATLQANSPQPSPAQTRLTATPGASNQHHQYGPDEYPPEKQGWHDDFETPLATPARQAERNASTPGLVPLDVSRLVTLPPPYPRHHPAMNNSHPMLSDLRNEHRMLADHSDLQRIKDSYMDNDWVIRRQHEEAGKERRTKLRATIQESISNGQMSFSDAAKAEAGFDAEEAERGKVEARSNFDVYEGQVAQPLNAMVTAKIEKADASINQLRGELECRNETPDPNQTQEEGDDQPERLEKLTLLKWLFEAREQLHKEMFDLHSVRSEKYSEVILAPYRITKAQAKIDEALAFFARDGQERQTQLAQDARKRYGELQDVFERNVTRGVEDQLSAFWDIAPSLLEIVHQIPPDLSGIDLQIPAQEYAENPPYDDFPLQYLYTLLSHAAKSAYQSIESQTNLLCLLHEVRTAAAKAHLRVVQGQREPAVLAADEELRAEMRGEMERARSHDEDRLTEDLKEKVGEVERQWREALGDGLAACKVRVREALERTGGWEEALED